MPEPITPLIIEPRIELQKFLTENGLSHADFGKLIRVGRRAVTKTAVSYWINGKRVPSPGVRLQIQALTKDRIKAPDWETDKERQRRHLLADFEARANATRQRAQHVQGGRIVPGGMRAATG